MQTSISYEELMDLEQSDKDLAWKHYTKHYIEKSLDHVMPWDAFYKLNWPYVKE